MHSRWTIILLQLIVLQVLQGEPSGLHIELTPAERALIEQFEPSAEEQQGEKESRRAKLHPLINRMSDLLVVTLAEPDEERRSTLEEWLTWLVQIKLDDLSVVANQSKDLLLKNRARRILTWHEGLKGRPRSEQGEEADAENAP